MPTTGAIHSVRLKLFISCWLIFVLHFATDIVREHYLAFSLAESGSFSVDPYMGLHIDIFELPGRGAYISNNPGVSMLGAIPYALTRPVISAITDATQASMPVELSALAVYNDPRPRRVEFYRKVRERGLDVRFGVAAAVMQAMVMAPLSALAAVVMFGLLRWRGISERTALLFAFLYALGTPVFFRTAYLNQNLLLAHLALFGFTMLWRSEERLRQSSAAGVAFAAGLTGGVAVLSDYSGILVLACLGIYVCILAFSRSAGVTSSLRAALSFAAGAAGPVLLLLFYQWRSFGNPWLPAQHYMPSVPGTDVGYQGFGRPQWDLFSMLLFDLRFGLFIACPLLILAAAGFWYSARNEGPIPRREGVLLLLLAAAILVFFSSVQYSRVEWVTGVRYVMPAVPALFLLAVSALMRLPRPLFFLIVVAAFAQAWCLSMVRSTYVLDSIARVMLGGFQLPWMNVLVKMAPQYFPWMAERSSAVPLFILVGIVIAGLWRWNPSLEKAY